jgi:uncharacterized protein YprB with RNaseH-like and TPR domain
MERPRTLVFDIETMGGLKAHMSEVEAFGYKWLGEGTKATVLSCLDYKTSVFDDRPLLKDLTKIWNSADCVIAHYGERFDRRFLNTRIESHGLPPLKPMRLIDTWRLSRDNFALGGNSLAVLLKFFSSPYQKVDLTYKEWRQVMLGHKPALRKLNDHCAADVLGLEWVFRTHLSHYTSANKLPNQVLVGGEKEVCPACGASRLQKRGLAYKQTKVWQRYYCTGCMKWSESPAGGLIR